MGKIADFIKDIDFRLDFMEGDIVKIKDNSQFKDSIGIVAYVDNYGYAYVDIEGYDIVSYSLTDLKLICRNMTEETKENAISTKTIINYPAVIVIMRTFGKEFKGIAKCMTSEDEFSMRKGIDIARLKATRKIINYRLKKYNK